MGLLEDRLNAAIEAERAARPVEPEPPVEIAREAQTHNGRFTLSEVNGMWIVRHNGTSKMFPSSYPFALERFNALVYGQEAK